jgi:hypothetical protein
MHNCLCRYAAVLSFHSCGANRDDDYHVPLPQWVTDAVARDPEAGLYTSLIQFTHSA